MDIEQKLRMTNIYSMYFLIASWVTSIFYWFDGADASSLLRLLLVLTVPVILGWILREKPKKEMVRERYLQAGNIGAIFMVGIVSGQGSLFDEYEYRANVWLSFFFYIMAIAFAVIHGYLVSCYRLFFCNAGVSVETRRRAGRMMRRSLWKLAAVGAAFLMLLLLVAFWTPEMNLQKEKTNVEQQENESSVNTASDSGERTKEVQQQDTSENVVLVILRRVLLIGIVLFALVVMGYVITRFVLHFLRGRRKKISVYEEVLEKTSDNEEYTRLVPMEREILVFPGGTDGKVRKRFYREVRRGAGRSKVDRSRTPQELREKYLGEGEKEEVLTALYEKARYGEESVAAEELHRLETM